MSGRAIKDLAEAARGMESGVPNAPDLEAAIDRFSLSSVLDDIAEICDGKAEHLSSNWQDEKSAAAWMKACDLLNRVADRISKLGL